MKFKIFVLCGIVLLLLILPGCTKVKPGTEPGANVVKYVVFQDAGYEWVVIIKEVEYLPDNPPGAVIKIRSDLDRNLTLDFDGPSHYTVSIGDKSERTLDVQEGFYKIMASSPGISFTPNDSKYFYADRHVYSQVWYREKLRTKY